MIYLLSYLKSNKLPQDEKQIHNALAKILPEILLPSKYIWIDEFPITPNGKIDKKSLPAPEYVRPDSAPLLRKPRTAIEKEIAEKFDKLTEEESEKMMKTLFDNEERELSLKKEYSAKFSAVIGKKRALKLLSLEHEFKRELLDVLRSQGPPPPPPHHRPNGGRP